jgi:HK97 family phage portal protein
MRLKLDNSGQPETWLYENNLGNVIPYELEDILHIKTSNIVEVTNSSVYFGLSPLESAWCIVKSSNEIFSAEASIFKNRGIIGILSNETDVPMLDKDRENLQEQFDSEVGGADRYNKIKISNSKLKYIQTGMSPTDLKLLEGIMNKLRLLCAIYGLSSVLFNDNENSTYNNVLEAEKASFNNVFIPLAEQVDRELSKWLSKRLEIDENVIVDKTSIDVIKASTNEIAQALNNLSTQAQQRVIASMTRNEARDIIGLEELDSSVLGNELVGDGKIQPEINNQNA